MNKLSILLVEDSIEDAYLVREALEEQSFVSYFCHVENGQQAIDYLTNRTNDGIFSMPNLILMDINMPVMDGHESLSTIKSIDSIRHLPVIMLTTSTRREDILKAYNYQCSSYLVKPDNIYELDDLAETIKNYWLTVKLPA
jgi:two-component system, chemotaxis family, response regulator Rcp1